MQLYQCQVRHAGSRDMVIYKEDMSPADIVLLKHLHGADSIVGVSPTREAKRQHVKERERLVDTYGAKVFASVFPGAVPRLPMNLAEAGLREDGSDPEAQIVDEEENDEPLPEPSAAAKAIADKVRAAKPAAGLT